MVSTSAQCPVSFPRSLDGLGGVHPSIVDRGDVGLELPTPANPHLNLDSSHSFPSMPKSLHERKFAADEPLDDFDSSDLCVGEVVAPPSLDGQN